MQIGWYRMDEKYKKLVCNALERKGLVGGPGNEGQLIFWFSSSADANRYEDPENNRHAKVKYDPFDSVGPSLTILAGSKFASNDLSAVRDYIAETEEIQQRLMACDTEEYGEPNRLMLSNDSQPFYGSGKLETEGDSMGLTKYYRIFTCLFQDSMTDAPHRLRNDREERIDDIMNLWE